jgi:two-component system, sensor histidine kinase and response regulator
MTTSELENIGSRNYFSKAGTMQEKGTGLGILLCKDFIKLNGGEMTLRSTLNKGTEVMFTLPLAETFSDSVSGVLAN